VFLPAPARLLAAHRARESARRDAAFSDPYARVLLGAIDDRFSRILSGADTTEWLFTARTVAFDRLIAREVAAGVDLVVNLAAGLDARPYRLAFPAGLRWVDVDSPDVLDYKAAILSSAQPSCSVTFHPVDLANPDARRGAFRDLGRAATRALVFGESLLVHLMRSDVQALSDDLAAVPAFQRWLVDLVSPPMMDLLNEQSGDIVRETGAPYLFAPRQGPCRSRRRRLAVGRRPFADPDGTETRTAADCAKDDGVPQAKGRLPRTGPGLVRVCWGSTTWAHRAKVRRQAPFERSDDRWQPTACGCHRQSQPREVTPQSRVTVPVH
jgi:methyltransferase (TIGR00027 family)